MATTSSVQQAPANAPAVSGLPADVVAAAASIDGLGDVSTLFTRTRLSADVPTVSHLLKAGGIAPYSALGRALTQTIENVNRAGGRAFNLNTIYGDFWGVDPSAIANMSAEQRAAFAIALGELNQALGGEAPAAQPAATPTDTVERQRTPPTTATPVPAGPGTSLPEPGTTGPQPAGAVRSGGPVRELPAHPALEGTSRRWRNWFAQGQRPEQTLALLLNRPAERITDLSAALTEVGTRYGIGQPGRENLEKVLGDLQEGLRPFGYTDRTDAQFGRNTLAAARALRAPGVDQSAVTNATARAYAGFPPLDAAVATPAVADARPIATPTPPATDRQSATPSATAAAPAVTAAPLATPRPNSVGAGDTATPLKMLGARQFGPAVRSVSSIPIGADGQPKVAATESAASQAQIAGAQAELRRKLYQEEADRLIANPAQTERDIAEQMRKRDFDDPRRFAARYGAALEVSSPLANAYLTAWLASHPGDDYAKQLLNVVPLAMIEKAGFTGAPLTRLRTIAAG